MRGKIGRLFIGITLALGWMLTNGQETSAAIPLTVAEAFRLPDTGQTTCYEARSLAEINIYRRAAAPGSK